MPITVAEEFGIDPNKLLALGAFDARLDDDNAYYVDPRHLSTSSVPEMDGAVKDLTAHFAKVIFLLSKSSKRGDAPWRAAEALLRFPEVAGVCLGYGNGSTAGSGIGKGLRESIISTVDEFVKIGIEDPRIFEFMIVVETQIGADRISDLTCGILKDRLLAFSERVFKEMGVTATTTILSGSRSFALPINPYNKLPLILVPADVLTDPPMFTGRREVSNIYNHNDELRGFFNSELSFAFKERSLKDPHPHTTSSRTVKGAIAHTSVRVVSWKRRPLRPF